MRDAVHIDAAGCNVGGHQNADRSRAEIRKGAQPLVLRTVSVQCRRLDADGLKTPRNAVRSVFGAGKNQHHVHSRIL